MTHVDSVLDRKTRGRVTASTWIRFIMLATFTGAVTGLAWGLLTPRVYVTAATFIPQQSESGSTGLAIAASQFGISLPSSGGGWGPAVYVALLKSRSILEPIAVGSFQTSPNAAPRRMSELLEVQSDHDSRRLAKTLHALNAVVKVREDAKLGAVRLVVTTPWPHLSLTLADSLIASVNHFNIRTRKSQAGAERRFIEGQVEVAERHLRSAENRLQEFLQANRALSQSPELAFERDRQQRDVELKQQTFSSLLRSLEEARLKEVRDTPVLTEVESPKLALIGESRHVGVKLVLCGFLAGFFAAIGLYAWDHVRHARQNGVGYFDAVTQLLRGFFARLRA